jgi:hypothetical protein
MITSYAEEKPAADGESPGGRGHETPPATGPTTCRMCSGVWVLVNVKTGVVNVTGNRTP